MKYISTLLFVLLVKIASAQSEDFDKKTFFEIRVSYMPTIGNVNIQGEKGPWINTLSGEGDNTGDKFSSTNIGFTYGKYLSPQIRLGLGADIDFYHNISQGVSSNAVPFFGDFKYNFNENTKGFFVYAQAGYSFVTGTDWHSGFKSGFGIGFSAVSATSNRGFNFSIGYNYQILNKLPQYILGPPTEGEGYYGPTTKREMSLIGYKNIILQTLPIKIAYEF